ncbi:biotin-independent malonate decarboxylase subunit beta [Ureibacillus sp. GCM10028918]|uniref:biotin-independent malonate decarboxylase subunit beta n=1 Tax=Ureibacillus sp. GCM10028918 TaxID=3273429 RepID=UPI003606AC98
MAQIITESLVESLARERAFQLLDNGSAYEILGPFDGLESPHLVAQNIVPQFDDGMIIVKGTLNGQQTVVISIEGNFQGGGIGEVSGAKLAGTLEKIIKECEKGNKIYPVIIYDTGGVRLQEANYGLLSIAEISAAIVALREFVPVIGIIPGKVGSFGGMSLTAGLCSALIMTREGRLGMNGPEVIEQEAGIRELDSRNKQLIWKMIGGAVRNESALADLLVEDDIPNYINAIQSIWNEEVELQQRTKQVDHYLSLFKSLDIEEKVTPEQAKELLKNKAITNHSDLPAPVGVVKSTGRKWFDLLSGGAPTISEVPSVLVADTSISGVNARVIAVVPNPESKYYRARKGEIGLLEGWTIAKYVRQAIEEDSDLFEKRLIIPIVDVPSQAFGYHEELFGIFLSCSAAVDAYATARLAGHPVIAALVGNAISGAFLSHGMQANRLIALNDDGVNVHVMSKKSAAIITQRTIEELDEAAKEVPSMAYDIQSFKKLGALFRLLDGVNAKEPASEDKDILVNAINEAYSDIQTRKDRDLSSRLKSEIAQSSGRKASIQVREMIELQWR